MQGGTVQGNLPVGWRAAGEFNEYGQIISVPAGSGIGAVAPFTIAERNIPLMAKAYIDRLIFRVVDVGGFDQIFFSLLINKMLVPPFENIPADQLAEDPHLYIGQVLDSGLLEIVVTNGGLGDLRCIGGWTGFVLSLINPPSRFYGS